jgi:predicted ATPase/class 3 adenylate cyclase
VDDRTPCKQGYPAEVVVEGKPAARTSLPTGAVTFLFSDIEGSTRLVASLGAGYTAVLERHQAIIRAAIAANGGTEVATEGDSFFVVFPSAARAIAAAAASQLDLDREPWPDAVGTVRVRMGIHTGEGVLGGDNYVGLDVHRAARIAAAAHGGPVLVSATSQALLGASNADGLALRDLGAFRLKDLDEPERLLQLTGPDLAADFPPPRTLETPSNLPSQVTSFVGREREVREIGELLGGSRLVTLTGPGGTGKTRLSLRVADDARPAHHDGVYFVELAPITDPRLLPTTIAQAIGLLEDPKRPVLEALEAQLRDRDVLLVLDNFEQVLDGADVVGRLIAAAPHLTVLATSREVLRLRGEQEYPVPPLELPDPAALPSIEALPAFEAVALFIERARAVQPAFDLTPANAPAVASICVRLDGLPLAIELAAARSKLFSPDAILARLEQSLTLLTSATRDLTDRQRTLRGAIDWSHDLLDPIERTLFRRLAIFVGGLSIEDATEVANPGEELGIDSFEALASFADKSLLRLVRTDAGEPRFRMLETIREYGFEKLAASADREPTRLRHEDHFAALAMRAEPELLGPNGREWLDRLELDRDNLRSAIQGAADDGRLELALRAGAALWRFWQQRGHLAEGRETIAALLARPGAAAPTTGRAKALAALGGLDYWRGDIAAAGVAYAEGLAIERMLGDPAGLADALYNAGFVAVLTDDPISARADYDEALAIYESLHDSKALTRVREALVFLMYHQGAYAAARELQEQNLAAFRASGESYRVGAALTLLAGINLRAGVYDQGRALLAEAVGILHEIRDTHSIVRIAIIASSLAVAEGQMERAARLGGAADALRAPLGDIATPLQMLRLPDPLPTARAALGDAAYDAVYAEGRKLNLDEVVGLIRG